MNIVGKIFIVLIFIMSLVFMSFAVAVYATHQNWRMVVERKREDTRPGEQVGLKIQLQEEREQNKKLKEDHEKLQAEIKAELADKTQALAKLQAQEVTLTAQRDRLQKERDDFAAKDQVAVATLKTEGENLKALTGEVEGLRKEIRDTQAQRDKHFGTVVTLTEDINQLRGQLERLKEREVQLAGDVAAARKVLAAHELTKDTPIDGIPPRMRGKVVAVGQDKLIEISLGSDDGLRVGHTLEVSRASKYLGRVEIIRTTFERAVAKIVPGYQQGVIQKGDDVATRLKVS